MSRQLLTAFQFLDVAGVCPNSLDNDFISLGKKLYIGCLLVLPSHYFLLVLLDSYACHQDIAAFLFVIGSLLYCINYLLVILTPALNPSLIVRFFRVVEDAQKSLTSLGVVTQPAVPTRATQLWYIGVFGITPVLTTVLMRSPYDTFYEITSLIATLVTNFAVLLKIKLMLLLLNNKFQLLNDRLKEVSDEATTASAKAGDFDVDAFLFKLHSVKCVKPKTGRAGITVDQVLKFNRAHFQLCDAHKTLESMFSLTALTETLFVSFLVIIVFTASDLDLVTGLHLFTYSFLLVFLFVSVLSTATDVKNNSLKTGYLVHELLNEELPFDVEEELQLFSRSLCLRKIGISAQGFFMVDLKLLTKIVCTLAPLILIMVQRKNRAKRANVEN